MKKITLLLIFSTLYNFAQIKGKVIDEKGNPIASTSIFIENTYNSTSTNDIGKFELNLNKTGKYVLVFQSLGFKSKKIPLEINQFPFEINVTLSDENVTLKEVIINTKENPALGIIRNAIASRKENSQKTAHFNADFYSKGIFKIKDLPKRIMGVKVDLDENLSSNLDATGSGVIYLSETVSKISFEKPDHLKERIIASKISGNDKGFSYNTARSTAYDFYNNTLDFNIKMISPIADQAFNYYKYKLEGTFFDENNQQINKIKVIAKRDNEPVFEGYLYIVDDSWAIYAVDLNIKGYRMKNEFIENMELKQNFSYHTKNKIWSKNTQSLAFQAGFFGVKFSGKFNYVYSNYEFINHFDKKTFGNEILSFEENANKKEMSFWNSTRPIPLTEEEQNDYTKKDSIQVIRKSKKYLDSIDSKKNHFKTFDLISGYNYKNSFQKWSFNYKGLIDVSSLSFNTVQGYSLSSGFNFKKWNDNEGKYTNINSLFNYGFSDNRLRVSGRLFHQFNNQNYANIAIAGGTQVNQFNSNLPISNLINTVSTLFFKSNFMKLYNLEFFQINYSQEVANGFQLKGKLEYQQRKPLFNTTDFSILKNNNSYISNNPVDPSNFLDAGFESHHLTKLNINAKIHFGNKYLTRPDGKFNIRNNKYPSLFVEFEKAIASNEKKYEFEHLNSSLFYELSIGNKGELSINSKVGKFFNAQNISFVDFKHFNGNQTHIGQSERYLNVFNFLPYYSNSTNDAYFETHIEHNDNGFLMNKIPLLNHLKSNLILGFHNLSVPKRNPYQEFTIGLDNLGFGKFKIFRLDYIRSYQKGFIGDGVIFGCKILNILE